MAGTDLNIFSVAGRAMSAQQVRMNTAASNLANASAVSSKEADAYRPIKAVFATQMDKATGLATVNVSSVHCGHSAAVCSSAVKKGWIGVSIAHSKPCD